jgi:Holliday junction DNA helicase RuvA
LIAALQGTVVELAGEGIVQLQCGPVTLELHMPASQALRLQSGENLRLYTHFHFSSSADMLRLYAFRRAGERDLFQLLLGGSGVGPRVALNLMDLGFEHLARAIMDSDHRTLSTASGVGPKLAQKIGVELADKVLKRFGQLPGTGAGTAQPQASSQSQEAVDAICALGFTRAQAEDSLAAASEAGEAETAVIVRRMLAWLSRN